MPVALRRKYAHRTVPASHVSLEQPASPFGLCPHPPGSVEKVDLLAARYEVGQPLFQRGDCSGHGYPIRDDAEFDPETDAVLMFDDVDCDLD